jgi:hypothetical protein
VLRLDPARREELAGTALTVVADAPEEPHEPGGSDEPAASDEPAVSDGPDEPGGDGRVRLRVTFQDAQHAEWALWRLGRHAEALAPQWLRDSLRDRAAAIAARYGAPPEAPPDGRGGSGAAG